DRDTVCEVDDPDEVSGVAQGAQPELLLLSQSRDQHPHRRAPSKLTRALSSWAQALSVEHRSRPASCSSLIHFLVASTSSTVTMTCMWSVLMKHRLVGVRAVTVMRLLPSGSAGSGLPGTSVDGSSIATRRCVISGSS